MSHLKMKVAISKQLTSINAAAVALSDTYYPVKILILRSELGSTALYETDDEIRNFATTGKIASGGSITVEVGQHDEIDLAKTYVQTSVAAAKLHVLAFD